MARKITNLSRGYGKGGVFKAEVVGLKELDRKLKALSTGNVHLIADIYGVVSGAAEELRDQMRTAAAGAGWGSQKIKFHGPNKSGSYTGMDAINSLFSYGKPRMGDMRKRISALAGANKQRTMVEWKAGRVKRSANSKGSVGQALAMAFVTMLEFGTSRMKARPALVGVLKGNKSLMIARLTSGFSELLEKYSK